MPFVPDSPKSRFVPDGIAESPGQMVERVMGRKNDAPLANAHRGPVIPKQGYGLKQFGMDALNAVAAPGEAAAALTGQMLGGASGTLAKIGTSVTGASDDEARATQQRVQSGFPFNYQSPNPAAQLLTDAAAVPVEGVRSLWRGATTVADNTLPPVGDLMRGTGEVAQDLTNLAPLIPLVRATMQRGQTTTVPSDRIGVPVIGSFVDRHLWTKGAAERQAKRIERDLAGSETSRAAMASVLRGKNDVIPNANGAGGPTAGEAIAHMPESGPLTALQVAVARRTMTPAGTDSPNVRFQRRAAAQEANVESAKATRDAVTSPMRVQALSGTEVFKPTNQSKPGAIDFDAANTYSRQGVPTRTLVGQVTDMIQEPGHVADPVIAPALNTLKESLIENSKKNGGYINAETLYTIRKNLGVQIRKLQDENKTGSQRHTADLDRKMQLRFDDQIEAAGGKGWKDYLAEYSKRSEAIDADIARREQMTQRAGTAIVEGADSPAGIAGGMGVNLLDLRANIANAMLRHAGKKVKPRVVSQLADDLLSPQRLGSNIALPDAVTRGAPFKQLTAAEKVAMALAMSNQRNQ